MNTYAAGTAADAIKAYLERVFGTVVFDALKEHIEVEYLGEIKVETAILERPDLFERAFLNVLGKVGVKVLADMCDELREQLQLETNLGYSQKGDFARFMLAIRPFSSRQFQTSHLHKQKHAVLRK